MTVIRRFDLTSAALPGLDRLSEHLKFHSERQRVIAGNLANLDTPGYRARDISFSETLTVAREADGDQTSSMAFAESAHLADDEVPDKDGNTVSLEGQMAKMDANNIRYRSLAEILSRRIGLLRYAATDGHS